jgi:hypothetical protein
MRINFVKKFFRKYQFYRELVYAYRAHKVYGKLSLYLYQRFWVRPQIKQLKHSLDRPPTRTITPFI